MQRPGKIIAGAGREIGDYSVLQIINAVEDTVECAVSAEYYEFIAGGIVFVQETICNPFRPILPYMSAIPLAFSYSLSPVHWVSQV